jgi:hypothetical protein
MQTTTLAAPEQLTNFHAMRQAFYQHLFTRRRDAQFELLDALLLSPQARSLPELSLSPLFRRTWASVYAALEDGHQDAAWWRTWRVAQLPPQGHVVLAVDATAWLRRHAPSVPERQFVHTPSVAGPPVAIGQPYALISWVPTAHSSWALPLATTLIPTASNAQRIAVEQIHQLEQARDPHDTSIWLYVADGGYSGLDFFTAVPIERSAVIVRLRRDRVLVGPPPPYRGRGRRPKHGARFACAEPQSWGVPAQEQQLLDAHWGQVTLRAWTGLHDRRQADCPFSVLQVQVHQEQATPPPPLWLAWRGPAAVQPEDVWRAYAHRWSIEPSIRFRKEALGWTRPAVVSKEAQANWTEVVAAACWLLYGAREVVRDQPLPWQRGQTVLTPGRVRAGLGALLCVVGTPAQPPRRSGKGRGWPVGRVRQRRERYVLVPKTPPEKRRKRKKR